ncbi:hypothetical protein T484DRAFT_1801629 [Baffinella frigidus]|nr:hypothetical protein T484DRAFT_1801629 [Cryptophyta sp. CCMP2293]
MSEDNNEALLRSAGAPGVVNSQSETAGQQDEESGAPPKGDVVGLPEFILKNHSLLSIWFATPEEAPPVLLPCICCCSASVTQGLSRRHRLFIFLFVVVCVLLITAWCQGSEHYEERHRLCIFLFVVVCVLRITSWCQGSGPKPAWLWNFIICITVCPPPH